MDESKPGYPACGQSLKDKAPFCARAQKKLDFENAQNVRGVEIFRHRTGILGKCCQTIL